MQQKNHRNLRISVCVKQVPDTTELRIDPETNTLIRQGVEAVLNPLDEFAIEAGLRLRENTGGSLTVFTMGPPQAKRVLEKAISMGADHGVLVQDKSFAGADTWATSLTLARALEAADGFDLILCGKQAIDGDTGQVGPEIAAHLGIPQITYVTAVTAADKQTVEVNRMLDTGTACVRTRLPALLTVLKEANEPRLPTLQGRLRAMNATHEVFSAKNLNLSRDQTGLQGSPTRVVEIATPEIQRRREIITGEPEEAARTLLTKLRDGGL